MKSRVNQQNKQITQELPANRPDPRPVLIWLVSLDEALLLWDCESSAYGISTLNLSDMCTNSMRG
jgi:hypothetical protein